MKDVVVTRKTMEYDGVNVTYATMNITGQDIMKFFPIGTRTLSFNSQMMLNEQEKKNSTKNTKVETKKDVSRKDRFILTYLTWIIVHRVLKPWPKKRSWFELSLVAHAVILSGWRSCLLAVRTSKLPTEIVMEKEMIFLSGRIFIFLLFNCASTFKLNSGSISGIISAESTHKNTLQPSF